MNCYGVLQLEFGATSRQVKLAYHKLARAFHPDKNPKLTELERKDLEDLLKKVNVAYEILGEETEKERYDLFVLEGGDPCDYHLLRVARSLTPGEDTYDAEDTYNGEDTHEDTHNGEYTQNGENTRSDPTRKRKRASSVQEQKHTSPRTSSPPRPLYNTDSYNAELEPRCFRYKRDINHLRTLAKMITRGNDKAIVVAVVRTEADRKRLLTTFPEHVITATPNAKGSPSLRV